MVQQLSELIFSSVIFIILVTILTVLGFRAETMGDKLKREVLKLPLIKPREIDSARNSSVNNLKRRWQFTKLFDGMYNLYPFFYVPPFYILTDDLGIGPIVGAAVLVGGVFFIAVVAGIFRIARNNRFWTEQLDPIKGIEADLERFVDKKMKEQPRESSSPQWYPEVDMNTRSNWKQNLQVSLRQRMVEIVVERELSPDNRQLLLGYLAQREDLIGQTASELEKLFQQPTMSLPRES
jgi:hypothetical protein